MTSGRVALVGLPDLLGEIVAGALREQPDLVVVGAEDDVHAAVERLGANVLVVNDQSLDGEAIADLLREHPDVQALDISADGSQAYAYRPGRVLLGGLSPEALGEAVRHIPGREAE
jgi:DNA-binding NarL/FixJ family response regulator